MKDPLPETSTANNLVAGATRRRPRSWALSLGWVGSLLCLQACGAGGVASYRSGTSLVQAPGESGPSQGEIDLPEPELLLQEHRQESPSFESDSREADSVDEEGSPGAAFPAAPLVPLPPLEDIQEPSASSIEVQKDSGPTSGLAIPGGYKRIGKGARSPGSRPKGLRRQGRRGGMTSALRGSSSLLRGGIGSLSGISGKGLPQDLRDRATLNQASAFLRGARFPLQPAPLPLKTLPWTWKLPAGFSPSEVQPPLQLEARRTKVSSSDRLWLEAIPRRDLAYLKARLAKVLGPQARPQVRRRTWGARSLVWLRGRSQDEGTSRSLDLFAFFEAEANWMLGLEGDADRLEGAEVGLKDLFESLKIKD